MKYIGLVVLSCALLTSIVEAGVIQIAQRPLRVLKVDSEIYITAESDLQAGSTYQDGLSVISGSTNFDSSKPSCYLEEYSTLPADENRGLPLKLNHIDGHMCDDGVNAAEAKFCTSLNFSSKNGDLNIVCKTDSHDQFLELSLSDFENIFGSQLRFGRLLLADPGLDNSHSALPELVLTPNVLKNSIAIKTAQTLKLVKEKNGTDLQLTMIDGKIAEHNDFTKAYCQLLFISFSESDPKVLELPNQLVLSATDVSADYIVSADFEMGFSTIIDLAGYEKPLRLLCSSTNVSRPLRYDEVQKITGSLINWIFQDTKKIVPK